jgi:tetratricopeptide (TPR) repeat protein
MGSITLQKYLRYLKIAASCLLFAMPSFAADQASMSKLSKAEKDFFFQTYETQPLKDRVERLEKRVLGSPGTGEIDQRLTQVLQAIGGSQEQDMQLESTSQPQSTGTESNTMLPSVRADDNNDNQDNALTARDTEIRNLLAEGVSLWRNKNLQEAIEKFEQVIRLDANNAEAYFSMGVVSESKGDLKRATAYYARAQELDPKKKEYKQASALVVKKLASVEGPELDKESQELLEDANDAFKNKEYLSALDLFKRLESKNPKVAAYKYNIGTLYLLVKNPFQALDYYKQALKLKPDEVKYQNAYQRVLAMNKQNGNINDNLPQQRQAAPPPAQKPVLSGWHGGPGQTSNQQQQQQMPPQQMQQNQFQPQGQQQFQPMGQQMPPQQQQQFQPQGQQQQFQPMGQQMAQMPPQQQQQFNPNSMNQSPLNPQNYQNQIVPGMVNQNQNKPNTNQGPMQNQNKPILDKNGFVKPPHMGQPYKGPGQQSQAPMSKKSSAPGSGILFGIGIEAKAPFPGAGLEVVAIMNGSRAQKAGILPQDSIMAVDGISVQSVDEANKILTKKNGGQPITIILKRGDRIGQLGI